MTRTYLRKPSSTNSLSASSQNNIGQRSTWRSNQNVFDDTLQSPDVSAVSRTKKALTTIGKPSLFSPETPAEDFESEKENSALNDTFDNLCNNLGKLRVKSSNKKENVDPFDALLESGKGPSSAKEKPIRNKNRFFDDELFKTNFSSPDTPEPVDNNSNKSEEDECGLFSSFSKETETLKVNKTPKIRKPNSYRARNRKSSAVQLKRKTIQEDKHNDTLDVKIKFSSSSFPEPVFSEDLRNSLGFHQQQAQTVSCQELDNCNQTSPPLPLISSMHNLLSPSSFMSNKVGAQRCQITSTPMLKVSSARTSDSASSIKSTDFGEDEVLSGRSPLTADVKTQARIPSSLTELSPTPMKHIKVTRGNKEFKGPIKSIMNHYNYDPSRISVLPQNDMLDYIFEDSPGDGNEEEAISIISSVPTDIVQEDNDGKDILYSHENEEAEDEEREADFEDESVYINCVCNMNSTTDDWIIQCSSCGDGFHFNCCNLNEKDVEELEKTHMTWACPRCLEIGHLAKSFSSDQSVAIIDATGASVELFSNESGNNNERDEVSEKPIDSPVGDLTSFNLQEEDLHVSTNKSELKENSLSMTAHLEAVHLDNCGEDDAFDENLLFQKPLPVKKVFKEPLEIELKPGKSWRRSISHARKTIQGTNFPSIKDRSKSVRKSRSSFIIIPSTPYLPKNSLVPIDDSIQCLDVSVSTSEDKLPSLSQSLLQLNVSKSDDQDQSGRYLKELLSFCSLSSVVHIDQVYDNDTLVKSLKVGEGAFGEVFLINSSEVNKPVLKVVPIGGDIEVNGEEQTTYEDILSEVTISSYLSDLRSGTRNQTSGFVELRKCNVFEGKYPDSLLTLWDKFDEEKESENDRPDMFPNEQRYIALEYGNGGKDLEKFVFRHPTQALAAWNQVAHTLAVAELQLKFEHRDLHWGNVLVKETKEVKQVQFILDGDTFEVDTEGVVTNIIDFSLSRLTMNEATIFSDKTNDPTLFTAKVKLIGMSK